jgi:hypothetical protein
MWGSDIGCKVELKADGRELIAVFAILYILCE